MPKGRLVVFPPPCPSTCASDGNSAAPVQAHAPCSPCRAPRCLSSTATQPRPPRSATQPRPPTTQEASRGWRLQWRPGDGATAAASALTGPLSRITGGPGGASNAKSSCRRESTSATFALVPPPLRSLSTLQESPQMLRAAAIVRARATGASARAVPVPRDSEAEDSGDAGAAA